ncbi:zinc finger imprinted 2 [Ochotona princeps]|uniref:zinc finger imprinted 2 n=1 Tax=Ochotona princeps TaxID=9978 RepID=UPI0027155D99|nr:zinc finger imprinted 2 [Ochotona princeps]
MTGPHQALDQIQELCRQWLQPETHTKEQIIDQLVLRQFLVTLPKAVGAWVRWRQPRNSKEAGTLVESFIQAHREEGVLADSSDRAGKNAAVLDSAPVTEAQELVTFEDVFVDFSPEEMSCLTANQRKLYREVTLENYQNLVFIGCQFLKPDVISYLEEEESHTIQEGTEESCTVKEDSKSGLCQDHKKRPETKEVIPEQNLPIKWSFVAEMETPTVDNFLHEYLEEPSIGDPSELHQHGQEKLLSSVAMSDSKIPHEISQGSDNFETNCNRTEQSENFLEKNPKESTRAQAAEKPTCELCKRTFSTRIAFLRHEQIHTGKKRYRCQQCGEAFYLMPHLIRHRRTHSVRKPPRCGDKPKPPVHPEGVCAHVRIHSREDYYECLQCGKAFIQNVHLLQHLQAHKTADIVPPKLPRSKTYLIRYQRKHGYVGEKACQCCDCGKTFSQTSHLIQHYRIHAHERPYQCQLCGKCYSRPSYLTKHYQFHFQEKALHCNGC